MKKIRGFKIGKHLIRVTKSTQPKNPDYQHLTDQTTSFSPQKTKSICKLVNWCRRLTKGAKALCSVKSWSKYGSCQDPIEEKPDPTPKGYSPVYVGHKDEDFHRVLVPVTYFNHPLFGELLREAEKEYGFHQHGGITIPCPFSEFKKIQTRIAATIGGTKKFKWKCHI
ncbi:hypothetical protein ACFE04_026530 [Oxalis oulophora]